MDVYHAGPRELQAKDFLAGVLRARSITAALGTTVDMTKLMARLAAPLVGTGTNDTFLQFVDESESNIHTQSENPFRALGLPEQGGFLSLPLATDANTIFESLRTSFQTAPAESVTPQQLLVEMLRADPALRSICSEFGLDMRIFE